MRKKYSEHQLRDMLRRMCAESPQYRVAAEIGVSAAYLSDVINGRRSPGPAILRHFGLQAVPSFETIDDK